MITKLNLDPENHALATQMASTHLIPKIAQEEISELKENIFLDDSLQGWTSETLRKAASVPGNLRILEDFEPTNGNPAIVTGNQTTNRTIILGYYRSNPRRIVLFPQAIELVAALPKFEPLRNDGDLLFRSVLLHEVGHWLTLHPERHQARINRCSSLFNEEAETVTELLNWLTFATPKLNKVGESKRLLQCQYLKRSFGPSWEYQVYPFWLFATGLANSRGHLDGSISATDKNEAREYLASWLRSPSDLPSRAPVVRCIHSDKFPMPESWRALLPVFANPSGELLRKLDDHFEYWSHPASVITHSDLENRLPDILDI